MRWGDKSALIPPWQDKRGSGDSCLIQVVLIYLLSLFICRWRQLPYLVVSWYSKTSPCIHVDDSLRHWVIACVGHIVYLLTPCCERSPLHWPHYRANIASMRKHSVFIDRLIDYKTPLTSAMIVYSMIFAFHHFHTSVHPHTPDIPEVRLKIAPCTKWHFTSNFSGSQTISTDNDINVRCLRSYSNYSNVSFRCFVTKPTGTTSWYKFYNQECPSLQNINSRLAVFTRFCHRNNSDSNKLARIRNTYTRERELSAIRNYLWNVGISRSQTTAAPRVAGVRQGLSLAIG